LKAPLTFSCTTVKPSNPAFGFAVTLRNNSIITELYFSAISALVTILLQRSHLRLGKVFFQLMENLAVPASKELCCAACFFMGRILRTSFSKFQRRVGCTDEIYRH